MIFAGLSPRSSMISRILKDFGRHFVKKLPFVISIVALVIATSIAAQDKVDTAVIAKIRSEGLEHSRVMETFDHLVNVIGPRLTASPAYKTAVDWTRDQLAALGFD